MGCGEQVVPPRALTFAEARFGKLKLQESSCAHAGMAVSPANDYSARLTQADFSSKLVPLGTARALWAARRQLLSPEAVLRCRRKLGELCWLATTSRPDICARLTKLAPKGNSIRRRDTYRVDDLIKAEQGWQPGAISKYASSSKPRDPARGDVGGCGRARGGKMHGGAMSSAWRPDAAYGDLSKGG